MSKPSGDYGGVPSHKTTVEKSAQTMGLHHRLEAAPNRDKHAMAQSSLRTMQIRDPPLPGETVGM